MRDSQWPAGCAEYLPRLTQPLTLLTERGSGETIDGETDWGFNDDCNEGAPAAAATRRAPVPPDDDASVGR